MSARILFYVQHLLGVGHLKRAEILAEAMSTAGLDVTVALGGRPLAEVPFQNLRVAQLPPAAIAGEDFSALVDALGRPVDDAWKAARAAALLELYRDLDPDVVLLELFPFGRRQFRFELVPLIEAVHATPSRPRLACSVRDILVAAKKPGRDEEIATFVRQWFDAVLVHGDPDVVPFETTFAPAANITDLIRYTGYVSSHSNGQAPVAERDEVLVSAGGGAVGAPLLFAALAARPLTQLRDHVWRFVAGPNLPDSDFTALNAAAGDRTIVERFRADFPARLTMCALSISQAGYNTTMDILRAGARAVVIPYETESETEQRLRSEVLQKKGLLVVLPANELSPDRLARAISAAFAQPRPLPASVDMTGGPTTAKLIKQLAAKRPRHEEFASSWRDSDCKSP